MISKEKKYNLHYGDVRGDVLPSPHAYSNIFHLQKLKNFRYKNSDILLISAQNIDFGYSFVSNDYPQYMFFEQK